MGRAGKRAQRPATGQQGIGLIIIGVVCFGAQWTGRLQGRRAWLAALVAGLVIYRSRRG